ncbi:hypothetical protein KJ785_05115 [Patescibacteria group bacterium]|nr:hypothetical protein [Patescibacteria group bacterium]
MTLRQYITIMILGSILCWTAWGIVIINIDPFQDTGIGFAFFYVSLFFALLGTISVLAFFIRHLFSREALPMFRYVKRSFSDAFFISICLVILLFLQGKAYLNWWNTGIFLLALAFILAFSFTTKKESV